MIDQRVISDLTAEHQKAVDAHGYYNSLHEGYAVLLEEVDELWEHVRKRRVDRSRKEIYEECIQIAAVAVKLAEQVGISTFTINSKAKNIL